MIPFLRGTKSVKAPKIYPSTTGPSSEGPASDPENLIVIIDSETAKSIVCRLVITRSGVRVYRMLNHAVYQEAEDAILCVQTMRRAHA